MRLLDRLRRRLACTTEAYDVLYARWLAKPGDLLDFAGFEVGGDLLDLCGGSGAVALEALRRGQKGVWLLDLKPRCSDPRVVSVEGAVEHASAALAGQSFDFIVCRQALGYLRLEPTFREVSALLKPGGCFAFNAFARPRWRIKPYQYQGRQYVEAAAYLGRQVFHLQAMSDGFDVTWFRWHTEGEIRRAGERSLKLVEAVSNERSMRFLFQKRELCESSP